MEPQVETTIQGVADIAVELDRRQARIVDLERAIAMAIAWHGADTESFVAAYGRGMTNRELCDRLRAVLGVATAPGRS